jgi:hypothetical protein
MQSLVLSESLVGEDLDAIEKGGSYALTQETDIKLDL